MEERRKKSSQNIYAQSSSQMIRKQGKCRMKIDGEIYRLGVQAGETLLLPQNYWAETFTVLFFLFFSSAFLIIVVASKNFSYLSLCTQYIILGIYFVVDQNTIFYYFYWPSRMCREFL